MVYQPSALFATAFKVSSAAEQGKKAGQFIDEKSQQVKDGLSQAGSAVDLRAQQAKQLALEKSGAAPTVSGRGVMVGWLVMALVDQDSSSSPGER